MTRKISLSIISAILLLFMLVGIFAFAVSAEAELDYSYPHATKTTSVYFDELLEQVLGISVSDVERDYLRLNSDFLLTYNYGIPSSYITTEYNSQSGELTVSAREYVYVAGNGVTVVWRPVSVSLFSELDSRS